MIYQGYNLGLSQLRLTAMRQRGGERQKQSGEVLGERRERVDKESRQRERGGAERGRAGG